MCPSGVWEFWSLAAAVAHIERAYLAAALSRGLLPLPSARVGLQEVLTSHADEVGGGCAGWRRAGM